jgi:transposase
MYAVSLEVRQLVVDAYERGLGTHEEIAELFGVGVATSRRLVRQWRKTGDLSVTYVRHGPPALIPTEQLEELRAFVIDGRSDWTNEQLKDAWAAKKNVSLSRSAMVRALQKLDLPLKKSRSSRASATGPTSSRSASSSSARSSTSRPGVSSSSTRPA